MKRRKAASGLAHLRKEDRDRLAAIRNGVELIRLPSELRADEIAADPRPREGSDPLADANGRDASEV